MRQPGIEPGAFAWEAKILPLNHWRLQHFYRGSMQYEAAKLFLTERVRESKRTRVRV